MSERHESEIKGFTGGRGCIGMRLQLLFELMPAPFALLLEIGVLVLVNDVSHFGYKRYTESSAEV